MNTPDPTSGNSAPASAAPSAPPAAAPVQELGHKTAKGFMWILGQSMFGTVAAAINQFALTWLLVEGDFALVGLCYSVIVLSTLLQQFGIKPVLMQRATEMERLVTPAFWMSLTLGLTMGVFTAAAGPVAAWFFHEPRLIPLLLVASLSMPLSSTGTVAEAQLASAMRFKDLASIGVVNAVLITVMSISMAFLGFGAYSIIVPQVIAAAYRLWQIWSRAPYKPKWGFQFKVWRELMGTGATVLGSNLAMMVTYTGHPAILKRVLVNDPEGQRVTGIFLLAYNLSDQVTRTLMLNLSAVLLPALATLKDEPKRQAEGFLKAMRGLMLVGMPFAFLQAAVAGPTYRMLLSDKWWPGIPVFLLFSCGMTGRLVLHPCDAMLMAQHRQKTWLKIAIGYAIGFVSLAITGSLLGRDYGVQISEAIGLPFDAPIGGALGVAIAISCAGPIAVRACVAPAGGTWGDVWRQYRFPLLGSIASAICAAFAVEVVSRSVLGGPALTNLLHDWASDQTSPGRLQNVLFNLSTRLPSAVQFGVGVCVMGIVYLLLVRQFAREDAYSLLGRIKRMLPARLVSLLERRARRKGHRLDETPSDPSANPPPSP